MNSPEYQYDVLLEELAEKAGMEYHAFVNMLIEKYNKQTEILNSIDFGKEPLDVDLMVYPPEKELTEEDFKEISEQIARIKLEDKAMNIAINIKRKDKKDDKQSSGFVLPNNS